MRIIRAIRLTGVIVGLAGIVLCIIGLVLLLCHYTNYKPPLRWGVLLIFMGNIWYAFPLLFQWLLKNKDVEGSK